ncbi:MAG TPA: hypothetical protein VGM67_19290 [Gemmatimonadaceae bacterium]
MSSFGGTSSNLWHRLSRPFWIALAAFWTYSLIRALVAVRAGAPDLYHNEHSRQIALDVAELLIAFVFIITEMRRVPSRPRYALLGVLFAGMIVSLIAAHRLAM